MKRNQIKKRRKMCVSCHLRRSRFMFAGRVRWDRFHSLCFRCYRSFSDRLRAALTAATDAITQDAENTFGVNPDPMRMELECGTYAVSALLTPHAGTTELVARVGTAQAALSGGNL